MTGTTPQERERLAQLIGIREPSRDEAARPFTEAERKEFDDLALKRIAEMGPSYFSDPFKLQSCESDEYQLLCALLDA